MKYYYLTLFALIFSSSHYLYAGDGPETYFTCIGTVDSNKFGFEYDLSKFKVKNNQYYPLDNGQGVLINDETITNNLLFELNVAKFPSYKARRSYFSVAIPDGTWTGEEICAGWACQPAGTPKWRGILTEYGDWNESEEIQSWENSLVPSLNGSVITSDGRQVTLNCSTYGNTKKYRKLKKIFKIISK